MAFKVFLSCTPIWLILYRCVTIQEGNKSQLRINFLLTEMSQSNLTSECLPPYSGSFSLFHSYINSLISKSHTLLMITPVPYP